LTQKSSTQPLLLPIHKSTATAESFLIPLLPFSQA
jgi:hypothetical protein